MKEFLFYRTCYVRNGNLLESHDSEICVKQIRVNQGVGVYYPSGLQWTAARHSSISLLLVTATKPEFQSKIVKLLWCT